MSKLYYDLARVYHEMYQTVFDYKVEYETYHRILKAFDCRSVLEVGCGSGNLARYFAEGGYEYTGSDISGDMLKIASENNENVRFLERDMRDLGFSEEFDAVIITGRSFTYMTANEDVMKALSSVNKALKQNGCLVFDNFNAASIFLDFRKELVQENEYKGRKYKRVSTNSLNMETGWTWNWDAKYYMEEEGIDRFIGEDHSVLRAFTEEELSIFLRLNGFNKLDFTHEGSAFTTIAEKAGGLSL